MNIFVQHHKVVRFELDRMKQSDNHINTTSLIFKRLYAPPDSVKALKDNHT